MNSFIVKAQQTSFFNTPRDHRFCHGGILRQKKAGRGVRPLSSRESLHVVFKSKKNINLRATHNLEVIKKVIKTYSRRFAIKVEQCSVQKDHIHLLIRIPKRFLCHAFFRVLAGQIAQRLGLKKLWRYRPFSRVVRGGITVYNIVRNYIQLNEQEALGRIPYRQQRLRGLSDAEYKILWS